MQRAMAEEALGKLRAVSQLFGAEEEADRHFTEGDYDTWRGTIADLENWVWGVSPIA
jgi:hypothetical protein